MTRTLFAVIVESRRGRRNEHELNEAREQFIGTDDERNHGEPT